MIEQVNDFDLVFQFVIIILIIPKHFTSLN